MCPFDDVKWKAAYKDMRRRKRKERNERIGAFFDRVLFPEPDPNAGLHALVAIVVIAGLIGGGYGCLKGYEAWDDWSYKRTMNKVKEREAAYREKMQERVNSGHEDGCLARDDEYEKTAVLDNGAKVTLWRSDIVHSYEGFLVARVGEAEMLFSRKCPGLDARTAVRDSESPGALGLEVKKPEALPPAPYHRPCIIGHTNTLYVGDEGTKYCEFLRRALKKPVREMRREYNKNCRKPNSEANKYACEYLRVTMAMRGK